MAGDQGKAPTGSAERTKPVTLLGSSMDKFKQSVRKMFNECRPGPDGLSKQGVSSLKQKLIRRL